MSHKEGKGGRRKGNKGKTDEASNPDIKQSTSTDGTASKLDYRPDSSEDILQTFSTSLSNEEETFMEGDYLLGNLNNARKAGILCDVTLLIGPGKKQMRVHRLVLSLVSEYFRTVLESGFKEGERQEVELPHMDVSTVETILNFAYTGTVELTSKNIEKMTRAANYFQIAKLFENCEKYIRERLNEKNCIEVLQFAEQIASNDLKNSVKLYFNEHFDAICVKNLDLMKISTPLLLELISDEKTSVHTNAAENEEKLFQLGWNHLFSKPDNEWKLLLPKLLRAVHLPLTSRGFLNDLMKRVEDHGEAKALVEKATEAKYKGQGALSQSADGDDEKWYSNRVSKSGSIFVDCGSVDVHNFKANLAEWVNGKKWHVFISSSFHPLGYKTLDARFECRSPLGSESVPCRCHFEICPTGDKTGKKKSHFSKVVSHIFTKEENVKHIVGIMPIDKVRKDYCDYHNGNINVVGHIEFL